MSAPLPPVPADEDTRLQAVEAVGAAEAGSATLDDLAALTARLGDVPLAFVNVITKDEHVALGAFGTDEHPVLSRDVSPCAFTIAEGGPLVVPDVAQDPRFADNPVLRELGVRFYAGMPVTVYDGRAVGALCVLDTAPRDMSGQQAHDLLATLARQAGMVLEAEAAAEAAEVPEFAAATPAPRACAD